MLVKKNLSYLELTMKRIAELQNLLKWIFNLEAPEPMTLSTFSSMRRQRMATKFMAITISTVLVGASIPVPSHAMGPAGSTFSLPLPATAGYISEVYSSKPMTAGFTPDVVLIQDLHVNRSA